MADEQLAAFLKVEQGKAQRLAVDHRDNGAIVPLADLTLRARTIMVEGVEEQARARGQGQEFGPETDQSPRRDHIVQPHATIAVGHHVLHLGLALAELLHDRALVFFLQVDGEALKWFEPFAAFLLENHTGTANSQFEAFAAHRLDQDRQVQFAAAGHSELVGVVLLFNTQGDIVDQFAIEAVLNIARGDELAFATGERAVIDLESHRQGRFVDGEKRQRLNMFGIADRIGNREIFDAGEGHDVAGLCAFALDPLQTVKAEDLQDLALDLPAIGLGHGHNLVALDPATSNTTDPDNTGKGRIVQCRHLELQRTVRVDIRARRMRRDHLEQGRHVGADLAGLVRSPALQGRSIDHREVELVFIGAQTIEQIEGLIDHPVRARRRAVGLVDHHDRLETARQRLLGDERCLRHRPVDSIDQQQHAIDHRQDAFDLAAEIGVSGRIDDIDRPIAPGHGRVLGKNGDAAFFFQIVGIHQAVGRVGTLAQGSGLAQQLVDQRSLAMVDVCHDGDVAQLVEGRAHVSWYPVVRRRALIRCQRQQG